MSDRFADDLPRQAQGDRFRGDVPIKRTNAETSEPKAVPPRAVDVPVPSYRRAPVANPSYVAPQPKQPTQRMENYRPQSTAPPASRRVPAVAPCSIP